MEPWHRRGNVYGHGHLEFYKYVNSFLIGKVKKNKFDVRQAFKSVELVECIVKSFKSKNKIKLERKI